MSISDLQTEIIADLTTELSGEDGFSNSLLAVKVKNAIREVKERRCYPSTYKDTEIATDLNKYYTNILNLARYDYNTIGAEGESKYSESGVTREYVSRDKMFFGVLPIATIV